jgi:hypothetical protein
MRLSIPENRTNEIESKFIQNAEEKRTREGPIAKEEREQTPTLK